MPRESQNHPPLNVVAKQQRMKKLKKQINKDRLYELAYKMTRSQWRDTTRLDNIKRRKQLKIVQRRLKQNTQNNSNSYQIWDELQLLEYRKTLQFPNNILYNSFNQYLHSKYKKYTPSNQIMKEMSGFVKYWIRKFYQEGKIKILIQNLQLSIKQTKILERIKQFVGDVIDLCIRQKQQKRETFQKYRKQLFQNMQQFNRIKFTVQFYQLFSNINKNCDNICNEVGNILDGFARQRLQNQFTLFKVFYRSIIKQYDVIYQKLKQRQFLQQGFRIKQEKLYMKRLQQSQTLQQYESKIKGSIKSLKKQLIDQTMKKQNLSPEYLNLPQAITQEYTKSSMINFAMGCISFIDFNGKYVLLKPVKFDYSKFNQQKMQRESKYIFQNEYFHGQRQIMRKFIQQIQNMIESKYKRFLQSTDIFFNIHTDLYMCDSCKKQSQVFVKDIQKILTDNKLNIKICINVSFNTSSKNEQNWKDQFKRHLIQYTDVQQEEHKFMLTYFDPLYIFPSGNIVNYENTYSQTVQKLNEQIKQLNATQYSPQNIKIQLDDIQRIVGEQNRESLFDEQV